jgi:diguanylate cyclase (GGDEF)-like protein
MNEEKLKSENLVQVSKPGVTLTTPALISRGLELAVQLKACAVKRQPPNIDWKALVFVNDERLISFSCAQLTMHGYRTTQASSSAEMLDLYKRENFHLIATSTETHALTITEEIHRGNPTIPVITIDPTDEGPMFRAAPFLTGPYHHREILSLRRASIDSSIDAEMVTNFIDVGINHFADGIWDFAEWSRRVVDEVGEWATPYLETVHDEISNGKNNFDQMLRVLYLDALTETHNRLFFGLRIAEELERARRFGGSMSLIVAHIDFFKSLNDVFGRDLGSGVLRAVATILKQQMRKMDVVCRYSGSDFMIIVPEATADSALRVAEKLRRKVEGQDFPSHGTTRNELVYAADSALAFAKSSGRNRVALAARHVARSSTRSL